MAVRKCAFCTEHTAALFRALLGLNVLTAVVLLALGANVQFPIADFPAVAMILMGVLALFVSLAGLVGSNRWKCCLHMFLGLQGLSLAFLLALVGIMLFNQPAMLASLHPGAPGTSHDEEHMKRALLGGKVVLLLLLPAEVALLVVGLMLAFWLKGDNAANAFSNFDESNLQERTLTMQALRTDIEGGVTRGEATHKTSVYNKVTSKMAAKYGEFSHGAFAKKSWFG